MYFTGTYGLDKVLAVARSTRAGWKVRSTVRSYRHDYDMREQSTESLKEWLRLDMPNVKMISRQEARTRLHRREYDAHATVGMHGRSPSATADAVLRWIETCP